MTRVIFYINIAESHAFLQRFLHHKVFLPRQTALIYGSEATVEELDRVLWDAHFLPHQRLSEGHDDAIGAAPIMLASHVPAPELQCDMLLSLAAEVPTAVAGRFGVFVDMVGMDKQSKQAGRQRYRYFKDHGYSLDIIDMAKR